MADPFVVWYEAWLQPHNHWYYGLTRKDRKSFDAVAEDAWQAGYDAGCQSENELWMYADKVQFNGSMYVRTIDKD